MNNNTYLKKIPQLNRISQLAKNNGINVWLVGGFLRDIHLQLNRGLTDFDFCVEKDIESFVQKVNKNIGGKLIVLDKKTSSFRIILVKNKKSYTYDFTPLRGKNIKKDLSLRDFTINTLAVNINIPDQVLDYYQGLKDLRKKKIKALSQKVIIDDPLRILRGFSFVARYKFKIDRQTLDSFYRHRKKIEKISFERINEELFKIFDSQDSYKIIKIMDRFRVIDQVLPDVNKMRKTTQGGFHHLNVWDHSIEALKQFELLCQAKIKNKKEVMSFLNQKLSRGKKRTQILKLACLLHDLGKPFVKKKSKTRTIFHTHEKVGKEKASLFAKKMRLSKAERQALEKMVFWHLRPGYLADQITPSKRAVYRFFRDTEEEGIAVVLLSLADWRATCGPLADYKKRKRHEKIMLELISNHLHQKKKKPIPRLIDGHDIIKKYGAEEGPIIGEILTKIKELQVLEKVKNKQEALKAAKQILKKKKKIKLKRK